jgi:hypothetical protein
METPMLLVQDVQVAVVRGRKLEDMLSFLNPVKAEHWRDGVKIGEYDVFNDITNVGKNYILDTMFHDGSQIASSAWCIGLISSSGYTALAAADTMGSHAGWTEFTGYSQGTRVAWAPGAASGQAITNGTAATFDITGSGTLKGVFVTSQNTKGGTTGTLWATALFNADVPVSNGDQIKITYTVSC